MADNLDFHGRSEAVFAVTISMMALCSIFVSLRLLSRGLVVKKIYLDDYFIMVAWVVALGLCFSICYGCAHGLGRHEPDIPSQWQRPLAMANYAFGILYQPALMATKTSILAFFLTFSTANDIFRWACWVCLFVVNAGGIALTFVTAFQCDPISALFQAVTPASAKCTDILTIYLSSIPLNIITDLAIMFLPMPILTSMRLPRKQKIILIVTFGFGILVVAVDVVRISYLQNAAEIRLRELQELSAEGDLRTAEATDSSFYLAFSFMWSAVEVALGISVACVPGLKPLVARFLPSMLRGPNDASSHLGSISSPNPEVDKPAPPVSENVHDRAFGRAPTPEDEQEPIDIMEFLTGRRDFARPASEAKEHHEEPMEMMDFLTTPEMALERSQTMLTNTTRNTAPESAHFFDFVNLKQQKSLVHLTNRESFVPVAIVSVLFFIWGFEYGLLDSLNRQFQMVARVTASQAVGLRSAYYLGYFVGPLAVGQFVLKHWGFKACYPIGLSIYASGCLIYWPAAVLTSWPTFLCTNFIVGFGLSLLEVSANPFIALCGPAEYAEMRLNLSQGIQAIGSVVAPLIADYAFASPSQALSLADTQWAYLGLSLATVLLAMIYFYLPLPEATDVELEDATERMDGANKARIGHVPVAWIVLGLGVFGQFCYVGGQEVIGSRVGAFVEAVAPTYDPLHMTAVAHSAFAVSRFMAAGLGFWIKPRILLVCCLIGLILFNALAVSYEGSTGIAIITMVFFFEGPLFSLIFAQGIRGQGKNTKLASVLITSSISGGAVFSPISTALVEAGRKVPYSLVISVAAFAACLFFALGLNGSRRVRKLVDPIKDVTAGERQRESSTSSRASCAFSFLSIGGKRLSGAEHREQKR